MRKAVILAAVFCAVSAASAITWPWAGKTKNAVQAQQRTNKESNKHLFYASDEYGTITFDWDEENKGYFVHAKWLTNIMTTDFSIGFTALTYPRDIIFYSTGAKWLQDWMNKDDLYAALNGINTVQFFAGFCTYFDSPHGAFSPLSAEYGEKSTIGDVEYIVITVYPREEKITDGIINNIPE